MAEYFELAAMAIATSVNPQAPAVLTASAVGAETAMNIDEAETPQDRTPRVNEKRVGSFPGVPKIAV